MNYPEWKDGIVKAAQRVSAPDAPVSDESKPQDRAYQETPMELNEYSEAWKSSGGFASGAMRERTVEEGVADARHAIGLATDLLKAAAVDLERATVKCKTPFLKWWNDGGRETFRRLEFSNDDERRIFEYINTRRPINV